jgi:branched-chain amino acid transport system substrate-binding protein
MDRTLTLGLTLSLSGRYGAMGRQALQALQLFLAQNQGGLEVGGRHYQLALRCLDDGSDARRCIQQYRSLCFENRADVILGPYSSNLARAALAVVEAAGLVMLNHGGADDSLYTRHARRLVGIASPAGNYFIGLARLVSQLKLWRKRVAAVAAPTPFCRAVIAGLAQACEERAIARRGVRLRIRQEARTPRDQALIDWLLHLRRARINVLVSAGDFAQDLALVDAVIRASLNIPVLACVAAGVAQFYTQLGSRAEGIVGPSPWEESLEIEPQLGSTPRAFAREMRAAGAGEPDYPAAQAYAAGWLALAALQACGSLVPDRMREAFANLRISTLLGEFAIDPNSGRQIGHQVLLVQWHDGVKVIIHPDAHADTGSLEFPSGWRLILASLGSLHLRTRRPPENDNSNDA